MDPVERKRIECEIVDAFLTAALAAGYRINIDNGGDEYVFFPKAVSDKEQILKEMFATGEERVLVYGGEKLRFMGSVEFVYGNDGYDVISDHSSSMIPLLTEALRLSEMYANA